MDSESSIQRRASDDIRSESRDMGGQKRDITEASETSESYPKRLKLHVESVSLSEAQAGRKENNMVHPDVNSNSRTLDLNVNLCPGDTLDVEESKMEYNDVFTKSRQFDLDLNTEDISSSSHNDPFYPYKSYGNSKPRDDECASSIGPIYEKDSMRVWKGLKQNNFLTASYGTVPMPMQKPRGRKKNSNDAMRKKIELAKKEQVDRFAKVSAPSGLLNGLNPGIINHVRNSKQVHSIIEALVKSERTENRHSQGKQMKNGKQDLDGRKKDRTEMHGVKVFSCERKHKNGCAMFGQSVYMNSEITSGAIPSENMSCLSNEEPDNVTSVNSLSFKAANVASQWLQLLNQDIRGRLSALRRSKKRVRAVITTELPVLISREFPSDKASSDAHFVRWSNLFGQMDKDLSEEESHLESWLNQVKEMLLHCESGLCKSSLDNAMQLTGSLGTSDRLWKANNTERELAVRAAAASIYSTCNFMLSTENMPCSAN